MTLRHFLRDVHEHASSNLMEFYFEQLQPTRARIVREHVSVAWQHARYIVGAVICDRVGHSKHVEVEDFVDATYETVPDDGLDHGKRRIVDIDGGGISWFCPRCGRGGSNYF